MSASRAVFSSARPCQMFAKNQAGERRQGGPIACLGSGTGLGETFLTCPVGGEGDEQSNGNNGDRGGGRR